jgi:hypothetical protein
VKQGEDLADDGGETRLVEVIKKWTRHALTWMAFAKIGRSTFFVQKWRSPATIAPFLNVICQAIVFHSVPGDKCACLCAAESRIIVFVLVCVYFYPFFSILELMCRPNESDTRVLLLTSPL